MNQFILTLTIVNSIAILYLTLVIYRRNQSTPKTTQNLSNIVKPFKLHLQRFNPFEKVGGDQSFILCLLDNTNSGVIITSLHSREATRVYAKTITKGDTDSSKLSREEIKILMKTISS